MQHQTYCLFSLGTNLGQRYQNLQQAIMRLEKEMTITDLSPVYETLPWGLLEQPNFLNMCVGGWTNMPVSALLNKCQEIEKVMGKKQEVRWGPRLIDIDILFYGSLIFQQDSLAIPHPRMHERSFVLVPLADIAPHFEHPQLKQTIMELLQTVVDTSSVYKLEGLPTIR